jgi:hypothetical protein
MAFIRLHVFKGRDLQKSEWTTSVSRRGSHQYLFYRQNALANTVDSISSKKTTECLCRKLVSRYKYTDRSFNIYHHFKVVSTANFTEAERVTVKMSPANVTLTLDLSANVVCKLARDLRTGQEVAYIFMGLKLEICGVCQVVIFLVILFTNH